MNLVFPPSFPLPLSPPLQLADSEAEVEEVNRSLAQLRKKTMKQGQELNDLKLHLESQQSRNAELEKRQRK